MPTYLWDRSLAGEKPISEERQNWHLDVLIIIVQEALPLLRVPQVLLAALLRRQVLEILLSRDPVLDPRVLLRVICLRSPNRFERVYRLQSVYWVF